MAVDDPRVAANVLRRLRQDLDNLQGAMRRRFARQVALERAMLRAKLITEKDLDDAEHPGPSRG